MILNTTTKSAVKYQDSILVWTKELAELRKHRDPKVEWHVDNVLQETYTTDSVLHAVDMRLGTYKSGTNFRPAFVILPKEHLVTYEETSELSLFDQISVFFQSLLSNSRRY